MSYPRLQALAGTALAVSLACACTIQVPTIVGGGDEGSGDSGGSGGAGGSSSEEGKLSSNGLQLERATIALLGTGALGAWVDETHASATSSGVGAVVAASDGLAHLEYLALCALDDGTSLAIDTGDGEVSFPGLYGFAPEWVDQGCGESCQRWVTSCLLAHTNVLGYSVQISMRGGNTGMAWDGSIEQDFPIQEAGFYGNLFALDADEGSPALYACFGRGLMSFDDDEDEADEDAAHDYLLERMCSTGAACGLISTGPCYFPPFETASTCESDAGDAGYYGNCHTATAAQDETPLYPEVVTTYLAGE